MKKRINAIMSIICYVLGIVAAIYCGGYLMLVCPIQDLLFAFRNGLLTTSLLLSCIIKIALSTTVAGTVWCIGYIGYNHFIGTEDEYDRLLKQLEEEKKERRALRKENREAKAEHRAEMRAERKAAKTSKMEE